MNLTELRTAVYDITNRPDLVSKTLLAIQSATFKAHTKDFYKRDLFESGLVFTDAAYIQQIDYKTLLPRWRAGKYFRKYDATNQAIIPGPTGKFTRIDPENVMDDYGVDQTDVWYTGGDVIHLKSSTEFQHLLFGAYLFPDTAEATFTSWIAAEMPWAIVFYAASRVFAQIGNADESSRYMSLALDAQRDIDTVGILDHGE